MANSDLVLVKKTWLVEVQNELNGLINNLDLLAVSSKSASSKEERQAGVLALKSFMTDRQKHVAILNEG